MNGIQGNKIDTYFLENPDALDMLKEAHRKVVHAINIQFKGKEEITDAMNNASRLACEQLHGVCGTGGSPVELYSDLIVGFGILADISALSTDIKLENNQTEQSSQSSSIEDILNDISGSIVEQGNNTGEAESSGVVDTPGIEDEPVEDELKGQYEDDTPNLVETPDWED